MSAFWKNFDEDNLPKANQELHDLIEVAQFNHKEREKFMASIHKDLSAKNISLDTIG